MDIIASNGSFAVRALGRDHFKCGWKKPNQLLVWDIKDYHVNVETYRGDFIEVVDKNGKVIREGGDGEWFWLEPRKDKVTLRFKKLPDLTLTKNEREKQRKIVTRYLISDAPYSLHIPDTLTGAIAWMQKQLKAVPAAYRSKAKFEFGTTSSYGETYANIEITYPEPETIAELTLRLKIEAERGRILENSERDKFNKLKTKFCPVTAS